MLSIAYGVNIESESDEFYAASEEAMHAVDAALMPGAFLVDALPIRTYFDRSSSRRTGLQDSDSPTVKYVPEWFPGAGFKVYAREAKEKINKLADLPFQHVKASFEVRMTILTYTLGGLTGIGNSRRTLSPLRRLWRLV
jgi:hypothetical protein